MAPVQLSDEPSGVFDQRSPSSYYSRNSYESSPSSSSGSDRGRHRSSSSSDSSSSRSRSRSHPRCHRHSHCRGHRRYSRHHASRRYRAHSRSDSRSPSLDRYHRLHRCSTSHSRSRSRASYAGRRYSRVQARFNGFPRSPSRSYRSPSRSSGSSVILSLEDKRELLKVARNNAMKLLGVEKLELPESVKPILSEQVEKHKWGLPESEPRVRPHPKKISSQRNEAEASVTSPKIAAKTKTITFSINNCVAKPTMIAPSSAKVTARVDSYESRKPYGHWVPVMSGKSSRARKQVRTKSQ
ncbi:arginine/serine-rich protein 1 [Phyllopteryx taeniolatus]|uniref:arginine/serine-rich protein 1 n=1 Tax=Phyllopteryx taeniolatus TaxID=161469 RepID=UPI002AD3A10E|nr:arginine/serine-rich protein 1 [Phyllopteryx taeniolatus]